MSGQLQDKIAIVTGASNGIGRGIAETFAAEGAKTVLVARRAELLDEVAAGIKAKGGVALPVATDLTKEDEVTALFAKVVKSHGRLDVLVNNAGIAGSFGTLDTYTAEALERLWAVNLTGPFLCAREAAARMRDSGRGGSIVNISSKAAVLGGTNEWVHYAASKGGIDTMTVGLAKELAPYGIRVNAVRPGLIESDFHLYASPGRIERMTPLVPMQRAGTADEVAEAVVWLASDAASYVTGAFIEVTGGR